MKIVFVCSGNTCRSPMANALFRQALQKKWPAGTSDWRSCSAGLWAYAGQPPSPEAVAVMGEEGIDISGHRSKPVQTGMVMEADLILTMTCSQRDCLVEMYPEREPQIFTLGEFIDGVAGEVADPYGMGLAAYRCSLQQIKLMVDRLLEKIIESD